MCNPHFHEFIAQLLHRYINTYKNVISIRIRIPFYRTVVHWHTGLHKSPVNTLYLPNPHTLICIFSTVMKISVLVRCQSGLGTMVFKTLDRICN